MPSALEKSALNRAEQESRKQKKPAGCALWAWQGLPKHSHPLVSHGPPSTRWGKRAGNAPGREQRPYTSTAGPTQLCRSGPGYEHVKPILHMPGPPSQGALLPAEVESRISLWSQGKLPWQSPALGLRLCSKQLEKQQEEDSPCSSLAQEAEPGLSHTARCFIHGHKQVHSVRAGFTRLHKFNPPGM